MRTRLSSVISLLMATVLVLGALFTSCSPTKKESKAAKYIDKIMEATFSGLNESAPQVKTTKLTFNNTAGLNVPHFVNAQATVITGKNGESAITSEITLDSGKVDFSLYNVDTTVVVGSSALGASKYGFELSDAGTVLNLFGSMFLPAKPTVPPAENPDGTVAPESAATGLIGALGGVSSLLEGENPEKVYALLEKYVEVISNAAKNDCKSEVKTGDEISVTVEFNTASAKKLIKDVFSSLKKDKELKSILENGLMSKGMTKAEAKAQVDALLSDDTMRSIFDMLNASPFTLNVIFTASKDYILNGLTVEYTAGGITNEYFFSAKELGKIELGYSVSGTLDGVHHEQAQKFVFESKLVDGASVFTLSNVLTFDGNSFSDTLVKATIQGDKYSVTYRVADETLDVGFYDVTISGNITVTENKSTVTLTSATALGKTVALDLAIETEVGGSDPVIPTDFKNLLNVPADEFKLIINNLKNSPLGSFIPENDFETDGGIVLPDVV